MILINEKMKCEQFHFYDKSVENCMPCKEACDPFRQATENECQIHCSAYLHWRNQFTTADDRELSASSQSLMMVLVLVCVCFLICIAVVISVTVICTRRKKHNVEKSEKSVETDVTEFLHYGDIQRSLYGPSKAMLSSLCQESDILSDAKTPDIFTEISPTNIRRDANIYIESPPKSVILQSTSKMISQETLAEVSHTPPTRPKETGSPSVAVQHQIESTSPLIELHEDFDCAEQAYDMVERGSEDVVGNFPCDDVGKRNLRISAILQRLRWVSQFWWDVEGAKVVVDASRQSTAKNDIRNILQREGIPSSEFDFQLVCPAPIFHRYSGSMDSELNS